MSKKVSMFLLIVLVNIILVEFSGHILYRIIKKRYIWETYEQYKSGLFNIRAFTEFIEDDRLVTNKMNFSGIQEGWKVQTDSNRFRIGNNQYFKDRYNFVFLGDSVPFGWGVDGSKSVPSKFYTLLTQKIGEKYGVINAAIPSYSLFQAVKRYGYEIDGKFPTKYVILQIYDPASQFVIWGKKWNKRICWTTKDTLASFKDMVQKYSVPERFLYKYSFIFYSIYSVVLKIKERYTLPMLLDINDKEAWDYFERENASVLDELYSLLQKNSIPLIILPVNLVKPLSSFTAGELKTLSLEKKTRLFTIAKLNQILRNFSLAHKNVYFFDIISYFDMTGREGMFIDGCHLTEYGAQKQAEFILQQLQLNNLL